MDRLQKTRLGWVELYQKEYDKLILSLRNERKLVVRPVHSLAIEYNYFIALICTYVVKKHLIV